MKKNPYSFNVAVWVACIVITLTELIISYKSNNLPLLIFTGIFLVWNGFWLNDNVSRYFAFKNRTEIEEKIKNSIKENVKKSYDEAVAELTVDTKSDKKEDSKQEKEEPFSEFHGSANFFDIPVFNQSPICAIKLQPKEPVEDENPIDRIERDDNKNDTEIL